MAYLLVSRQGKRDTDLLAKKKEGGDPANAGLQHARVFLETVKSKHPW